MAVLSNNGLAAPSDFPSDRYEAVHSLATDRWRTHQLYEHFSAAWNAVAYRFLGTVDAGAEFQSLLKFHGASPPPLERYLQERALFDFFSSGFSVFESLFYALFAIGALLEPDGFPLATSKDEQRISPSSTAAAYKKAFMGDAFIDVFDEIFQDLAYKDWREVRNILTHRTAPGRRMYVSIGDDDAPSTEWKLKNIVLDQLLVQERRASLSAITRKLLTSSEAFLKRRV